MYRLLAIDIDGTLLNSRQEVTPAIHAALGRASRAGIRVVPATGRRYRHVLPIVELLGIRSPLVTASGALVKDPTDHDTLYQAAFEPQTLLDVIRLIDAQGYDPVFFADTYAEGFDYYVPWLDMRTPELARYVAKNSGHERLCPNMLDDPPPGLFAGFTSGTRQQMLDLEQVLHGRMPDKLQTSVVYSPVYSGSFLEVAPPGVSKWSGILHLAEQWGIAEDEICAVGDDRNDLSMIRAAGLGVAMGNASTEIKDTAHRIAPSHDDDGLVQVVDWLLE